MPDITVKPNGTLEPLRNVQSLASLEAHPWKKLDLFAYTGAEYVQRTYYRGPTGTLVDIAPPTANNAGCETEAAPTSGTGYAPGTGPCSRATRLITQGSLGWVYLQRPPQESFNMASRIATSLAVAGRVPVEQSNAVNNLVYAQRALLHPLIEASGNGTFSSCLYCV